MSSLSLPAILPSDGRVYQKNGTVRPSVCPLRGGAAPHAPSRGGRGDSGGRSDGSFRWTPRSVCICVEVAGETVVARTC